MTIEKLYTPSELAALIGVAKTTLGIWRWKQYGPAYHKLGKSIRYPASEVQKWMDTNTVQTAKVTE